MMKTFPGRIRVQSSTVLADACTIRSARNLAISFGTWGTALVMLNGNIRNLYMPENMRTPLMHGPDGLPCTTFAFPGYDGHTMRTMARFTAMTEFPSSKVCTSCFLKCAE